MSDVIDYGNLMHSAMRSLIRTVLSDVQAHGLPGEHHFFITFDTTHPDVSIAAWLSDRYPSEMTVVMQHWYDGLDVQDDGFAITLNFGDAPEPLYVPYDAIRTFVDPSVEFGLRFEGQEEPDEDEPLLAPVDGESMDADEAPSPAALAPAMLDALDDMPPQADREDEDTDAERKPADVVSLDSFRK